MHGFGQQASFAGYGQQVWTVVCRALDNRCVFILCKVWRKKSKGQQAIVTVYLVFGQQCFSFGQQEFVLGYKGF